MYMKLSKSILVGLVLLLMVISNAFAQTVFDVSRLALINPSNKTIGLVWGESTAKCVQVFGQPSSTSSYHSELDDATITVYNYGANKIEFLGDKMIGYELSTPSIVVGTVNGQTFKVGDRGSVQYVQVPRDQGPGMPGFVTEERRIFLDFPLSTAGGQTRGKSFTSVSIVYVKNGGTRIDSRVELLLDANQYVTSIALLN